MTAHHNHASPADRKEFLVDGCPRCAEYVRDIGIHFDVHRFRAFWAKMLEVEYGDYGAWGSELDQELGRTLYRVSLALERAFSLNPHALESWEPTMRILHAPPDPS